jgi:hypothetical protein
VFCVYSDADGFIITIHGLPNYGIVGTESIVAGANPYAPNDLSILHARMFSLLDISMITATKIATKEARGRTRNRNSFGSMSLEALIWVKRLWILANNFGYSFVCSKAKGVCCWGNEKEIEEETKEQV